MYHGFSDLAMLAFPRGSSRFVPICCTATAPSGRMSKRIVEPDDNVIQLEMVRHTAVEPQRGRGRPRRRSNVLQLLGTKLGVAQRVEHAGAAQYQSIADTIVQLIRQSLAPNFYTAPNESDGDSRAFAPQQPSNGSGTLAARELI